MIYVGVLRVGVNIIRSAYIYIFTCYGIESIKYFRFRFNRIFKLDPEEIRSRSIVRKKKKKYEYIFIALLLHYSIVIGGGQQ